MHVFGLAFLRALIVAVGLTGVAFSAATAQEGPISDAKLQSFVVAAMKVSDIVEQWTPRIEAAKTPEEKARLKSTANGELTQAIQSTGDLTVQEYQQIGQRAQGDQALQERIMKIVQSDQPDSQPQR